MPAELALLIQTFSEIWKIIFPYLLAIKAFVLQFWILALPFIAYRPLRFLYPAYIHDQWDFMPPRKRIVLEIKVPQTNLRPIKAMENVFNSLWGTWDPPSNWKADHFEGKKILGMSFELVGIDGIPHFFVRLPAGNRKLFEAAVYSQYPDVEIVEVPDYVKNIPTDIPNREWDLWGTDFVFTKKEEVYPIKTYEQFFEEKPDVPKEEKRIDPLSSLFETISKTGPGEQVWIQIWMMPVGAVGYKADPLIDIGKKLIDKLVKRPEKAKPRTLIADFWELLIHGKIPEGAAKEESFLPPEMKLTSGEKEVVSGIERKISKNLYWGFIKYLYVAKRKVFFNGSKGFAISFFSQFNTQNMNSLRPFSDTITKVQAPEILTDRKLYLRKRDLFSRYSTRDNAFVPFPGGMIHMNVEELATLYHFPGLEAVPTMSLKRIESKKAAPPVELPVE